MPGRAVAQGCRIIPRGRCYAGNERLVLGGGGNLALGGEVGDESLYFLRAHVLWVALLVEEDVALDLIHVGLFSAVGVVLRA